MPAGLRVSELARLQAADIHSERMLIRVNQGKGCKDRYTLAVGQVAERAPRLWKLHRPPKWLFPGRVPTAVAKERYETTRWTEWWTESLQVDGILVESGNRKCFLPRDLGTAAKLRWDHSGDSGLQLENQGFPGISVSGDIVLTVS